MESLGINTIYRILYTVFGGVTLGNQEPLAGEIHVPKPLKNLAFRPHLGTFYFIFGIPPGERPDSGLLVGIPLHFN